MFQEFLVIYNSRNFKGTLANIQWILKPVIYNSRNFKGTLAISKFGSS